MFVATALVAEYSEHSDLFSLRAFQVPERNRKVEYTMISHKQTTHVTNREPIHVYVSEFFPEWEVLAKCKMLVGKVRTSNVNSYIC